MKKTGNRIYISEEELAKDVDCFLELSQTNDIYISKKDGTTICMYGAERYKELRS